MTVQCIKHTKIVVHIYAYRDVLCENFEQVLATELEDKKPEGD